jgi:hypothetical protein
VLVAWDVNFYYFLLLFKKTRPELFSQLIMELKNMPDHAVLKLVREVRDGEW